MRSEKVATWSGIPTSQLRAELLRRQSNSDERPACGTARHTKDYNMPLHVFALFLILTLSTLGQSCLCQVLCSATDVSQRAHSLYLSGGSLACQSRASSSSYQDTLAPVC
jgi:hypothetical protein